MTARIGSLFSGYGGLDLGVMAAVDSSLVWHVEYDAAPSKILAHHWPTVPNFGDVTKVDWSAVEPVDILTGGFPCQDVSLAGRRAGMKNGTRSGLWSEFARAIDVLRPQLVVIENVRGLLSAEADRGMESDAGIVGDGQSRPVLRALGAVLGDLADLGYDAEWCGVRAADAGAPHGRFRVFVVAYPCGGGGGGWASESVAGGGNHAPVGSGSGGDSGGHDSATDPSSDESERRRGLATVGEKTAEGEVVETERERVRDSVGGSGSNVEWGAYELAIRGWESVTGRVAPVPTLADGKNGQHRLSACFVEWMMGLEDGHVTAPEIGLTRNEQLRALGNGVVPQQAALALLTLGVTSEWLTA